MTCVHLRKLYDLCRENNIKLAGADLIHIVCTECGEKQVCPSAMMDELSESDDDDDQGQDDSTAGPATE